MDKGNARALILDRDGTVNVNFGYVYEPERFVFIDGIFELCRAAAERGYKVIIVSNQSGVTRGYYSEAQMDECNARMVEAFKAHGVDIAEVICCTALDDADARRKPNPGMFYEAIEHHNLDAKRCVALGDGERDAVAARRAGVAKVLLLAPEDERPGKTVADAVITSLTQAIPFLEDPTNSNKEEASK